MKLPWKRQFWEQWWAHLRPILGLTEEDRLTEPTEQPQTPEPVEEPSHPTTIPEAEVDDDEKENSDPETETGP